jgi:hypothetical protein
MYVLFSIFLIIVGLSLLTGIGNVLLLIAGIAGVVAGILFIFLYSRGHYRGYRRGRWWR